MRIAFFTPLNPIQSGISDYSEELLPLLARGAEIDVFIDRYKPARSDFGPNVRVLRAGEFAAEQRRGPYDEIVYQMGNSPAHAYMYEHMAKAPGVVVLHEFVLHHLRMWMSLTKGKGKAYLREMEQTYGAAGKAAAERVLLGQHPEALFEFPLVESTIRQAKGIIVHSRYMAGRVREVQPDAPLAVVPMGVPLPPFVPRAEARARLGLDADTFIISSLGHLNPYKRLNVALRAYKAFAMHAPRSTVLLVGSKSPNFDVDRTIGMLGLRDRVRVVGFAPQREFQDYVGASDICINLRYPTAGETSAALLRIMGAGKPVLVSDIGSFGELPDSAAAKIDVGGIEEQLLLEYMLLLARDVPLRLAMGRAARAFVAREHTLEGAAAGYLSFLARLSGSAADPGAFVLPVYEAEDWPESELAATAPVLEEARQTSPPTPLPVGEGSQVGDHRWPDVEAVQLPSPTGRGVGGEVNSFDPVSVLAAAAADLELDANDPSLAGLVRAAREVL